MTKYVKKVLTPQNDIEDFALKSFPNELYVIDCIQKEKKLYVVA